MKNSQAVVINSDMDHFKFLEDQVTEAKTTILWKPVWESNWKLQSFRFSATGKLAGN